MASSAMQAGDPTGTESISAACGTSPATRSPPQAPEGPRCGLCGCGGEADSKRLMGAGKLDEQRAGKERKNFLQDIGGGRFEEGPGWLGPLLGPLSERIGVAGVWVHRECAIWSPEVYFVHGSHLKNVQAAVRRGRALRCTRCGKAGATIGCWIDRCPKTFHLPCARVDGCQFNHKDFLITCEDHTPTRRQKLNHLSSARPATRQAGRHKLAGRKRGGRGVYGRRAAALAAEQRMAAALRLEAQLAAHSKPPDLANDEEDFLKRERRRLARDLAHIVPLRLGGEQPDSVDADSLPGGWETVAGLQDVVKCLKEMVLLPLLYPGAFERMGIAPARGILLHGHPGTGKTLVARALAGACARSGHQQVAYFARKGADCLGKYVGDAERQLRLLFQVAEQCQPSIIFFDEIDGLAPERSAQQDQTQSSVVSTLLALMDGVNPRGAVVVIGATNRPDAIDPALRRPGRFDREVYFPLPSAVDRAAILAVHSRHWEPAPPAPLLAALAQATPGFAGADLAALCSQAAMAALKRACPGLLRGLDTAALPKLPAIAVQPCDWATALAAAAAPCSRRQALAVVSEATAAPLPHHLAGSLALPLAAVLLGLSADTRLALPLPAQRAVAALRAVLQPANGMVRSEPMLKEECLEAKGCRKEEVQVKLELSTSAALSSQEKSSVGEVPSAEKAAEETPPKPSPRPPMSPGGVSRGVKRRWSGQGSECRKNSVRFSDADCDHPSGGSDTRPQGGESARLGLDTSAIRGGLRGDHDALGGEKDVNERVVEALTGVGLVAGVVGVVEEGATVVGATALAAEGRSTEELFEGESEGVGPQKGCGFRVLVSGQGAQGQAALSSALLAALEGLGSVRVVNYPSMVLAGNGDATQGLTLLLDEARQGAPCVLFLPRIESWAAQKLQAAAVESGVEGLNATPASRGRPHFLFERAEGRRVSGECTTKSSEGDVKRVHGGASEATVQGSEGSERGVEGTSRVRGWGGLVVSAAWKVFLQQMRGMSADVGVAVVATSHDSGEVLPAGLLDFFAAGGSRTAPLSNNIDIAHWEHTLQGQHGVASVQQHSFTAPAPRLPNLNRGVNPFMGGWGEREDAVGEFASPEASAVHGAKAVPSSSSRGVPGISGWAHSRGRGGQVGSTANAATGGQRKAVAQQSRGQRSSMPAFWVELTSPSHSLQLGIMRAAAHSLALQLASAYTEQRRSSSQTSSSRKRTVQEAELVIASSGEEGAPAKLAGQDGLGCKGGESEQAVAGPSEPPAGVDDAEEAAVSAPAPQPTQEERSLQAALSWCGLQLLKAPAYARLRRASLLIGADGRPRATEGGLAGVGQRACSWGFTAGQELYDAVRKVADDVRRREERRLLKRLRVEGEAYYSGLLRACSALEDTVACWAHAMCRLEFAAHTARDLLAPKERFVPPVWKPPPLPPVLAPSPARRLRPSIGRSNLRAVSYADAEKKEQESKAGVVPETAGQIVEAVAAGGEGGAVARPVVCSAFEALLAAAPVTDEGAPQGLQEVRQQEGGLQDGSPRQGHAGSENVSAEADSVPCAVESVRAADAMQSERDQAGVTAGEVEEGADTVMEEPSNTEGTSLQGWSGSVGGREEPKGVATATGDASEGVGGLPVVEKTAADSCLAEHCGLVLEQTSEGLPSGSQNAMSGAAAGDSKSGGELAGALERGGGVVRLPSLSTRPDSVSSFLEGQKERFLREQSPLGKEQAGPGRPDNEGNAGEERPGLSNSDVAGSLKAQQGSEWRAECFQVLETAVGKALVKAFEEHLKSTGRARRETLCGGGRGSEAQFQAGHRGGWVERVKGLAGLGLSLEEVADALAWAGSALKRVALKESREPSQGESLLCHCQVTASEKVIWVPHMRGGTIAKGAPETRNPCGTVRASSGTLCLSALSRGLSHAAVSGS